ncbi:helix-turn-helix domain-containing protein [Micromonospora sp. WMMA1923]|uniref:AraC-like ligand-binding domain-containing protein n=1 Tax=Micromonospora sp. WMMA1923 TaxID=3404125 RepID=UPI003B9273BC
MINVFDSATIPVRERLDAWWDVADGSLMPTTIHSPDPEAFTARLSVLPLGQAQVASMVYASLSSRRSPKDIRRSDPESYQFALIRAGRQGIEQNGTSAVFQRGDLVIYDSSRPFEAVVSATTPAQTVLLQFPRRMLPLPADQVAALCGTSLTPGSDGIARLLATFLTTLTDNRTPYTPPDALRLETVVVDLTTAVLAHHLDHRNPPLRSTTHTLYLRIIAFIDDNLHDPHLRPTTIAAAHQISLRYLHRIFQRHHPDTVATHIRTRRLDKARHHLTDPHLTHLTIATIARRCGYTRPADFTRAFHHHTGTPPRDYRNNT